MRHLERVSVGSVCAQGQNIVLGEVQSLRILEELRFVHRAEWYSIHSYGEFCSVNVGKDLNTDVVNLSSNILI